MICETIIGQVGLLLAAAVAALCPQIQSNGCVTLNSDGESPRPRPITGPVPGLGQTHHPSILSWLDEPRIQDTEQSRYALHTNMEN